MLNDDLDQYLKDKLDGNPQWDKEALWADIDHRLDEPKRDNRFGFIVLGFCTLLIVGILSSLYFGKGQSEQTNTQDIDTAIIHETQTKPSITKELTGTPAVSKPEHTFESIDQASSSSSSSSSSSEVALNNEKEGLIKSEASNLVYQSKPVFSTEETKRKIHNPNASLNDVNQRMTESLDTETLDDLNAVLDLNLALVNKTSIKTIEVSEIGVMDPAYIQIKRRNIDIRFAEIETTKLQIVQQTNKLLTLGLYAGIGTSFRDMSSKVDGLNPNVVSRIQNESLLESIEFGFHFRTKLGGSIHLATGLNSYKQTEKLSASFLEVRTESRNKMDAYVFNNDDGTQQFISAVVETEVANERNIVNYNTFSSTNIPLLIGYHKRFSSWQYIVEVGPSFQFNQSYDGTILSGNNVVLENEDASDIYHRDFSTMLELGGHVSYLFSKRLSLDFGISVRKQLGSVLKTDINYDLRYTQLSSRIGMSYWFY